MKANAKSAMERNLSPDRLCRIGRAASRRVEIPEKIEDPEGDGDDGQEAEREIEESPVEHVRIIACII